MYLIRFTNISYLDSLNNSFLVRSNFHTPNKKIIISHTVITTFIIMIFTFTLSVFTNNHTIVKY